METSSKVVSRALYGLVLAAIGYQDALQRDIFSFWQPLDFRHQRAMAEMAQALSLSSPQE